MTLQDQLRKMAADWDQRALANARYFVATGNENWSDEDFYASGAAAVQNFILSDMANICQGKGANQMRVLEIGCGAGRITRALANLFGEVHAVDISGEMIAHARRALTNSPNTHVYQNNGQDLSVLPPIDFDFAFSHIVFQHIPSYQVIETYINEVSRVLKPACLFKFQVQGNTELDVRPDDTWVGVGFSEEQMRLIAARANFEMRYCTGQKTQDFWLWFFRHA